MRSILAAVALWCASGLLYGTAIAQDFGVAGEIERLADSSPQEKLTYAADATSEMDDVVKRVSKSLDTARREADPSRINCLRNNLASMRSLLAVSQQAEMSMSDAIAAGEVERADHELRKIAVAVSNARQLSVEADGCGYDSSVQSGETDVIVEGGEFAEEDETAALDFDVEVGFDPPESSPFK